MAKTLSKKQDVQNSEDSELERRHARGPVDQQWSLRGREGEVDFGDLKGTIAPSRGGSYSITLLTCTSPPRINSI